MSHLRKNITLGEKDAGTTKSLKTSLSFMTIVVDTEYSVIIDHFKEDSQQYVEWSDSNLNDFTFFLPSINQKRPSIFIVWFPMSKAFWIKNKYFHMFWNK